jgi:hypothetical protein
MEKCICVLELFAVKCRYGLRELAWSHERIRPGDVGWPPHRCDTRDMRFWYWADALRAKEKMRTDRARCAGAESACG